LEVGDGAVERAVVHHDELVARAVRIDQHTLQTESVQHQVVERHHDDAHRPFRLGAWPVGPRPRWSCRDGPPELRRAGVLRPPPWPPSLGGEDYPGWNRFHAPAWQSRLFPSREWLAIIASLDESLVQQPRKHDVVAEVLSCDG